MVKIGIFRQNIHTELMKGKGKNNGSFTFKKKNLACTALYGILLQIQLKCENYIEWIIVICMTNH